MKIRLRVNEISYTPELPDPDMTLLFFLRNVLGLTAAKNGCGEGHCGARRFLARRGIRAEGAAVRPAVLTTQRETPSGPANPLGV